MYGKSKLDLRRKALEQVDAPLKKLKRRPDPGAESEDILNTVEDLDELGDDPAADQEGMEQFMVTEEEKRMILEMRKSKKPGNRAPGGAPAPEADEDDGF